MNKWKEGKEVRYAMQFAYEDRSMSKIAPWSDPYIVDEVACPSFFIPPVNNQDVTKVLIFRQFDKEIPELVGSVKPSNESQQFRDIDRDLYNAAGTTNKKLAMKTVERLLENGVNRNVKFEGGASAIHAAARVLNVEIIEMLIDNETSINKADGNWNSPLHLALMSKYLGE